MTGMRSRAKAILADEGAARKNPYPSWSSQFLSFELITKGYRPVTARCCGGMGCPDCQGVGIEWLTGTDRDTTPRMKAGVTYRNGYLVGVST